MTARVDAVTVAIWKLANSYNSTRKDVHELCNTARAQHAAMVKALDFLDALMNEMQAVESSGQGRPVDWFSRRIARYRAARNSVTPA